jgi:hypothetical protein
MTKLQMPDRSQRDCVKQACIETRRSQVNLKLMPTPHAVGCVHGLNGPALPSTLSPSTASLLREGLFSALGSRCLQQKYAMTPNHGIHICDRLEA